MAGERERLTSSSRNSSVNSERTLRPGDTGNIGRRVAAETEGGSSVRDVTIIFDVSGLSERREVRDRIRAEERERVAREEEGWVDFFKYALDYKDEEQPAPSIGAFYHNSFGAYGNALREVVTKDNNGDVISDSVEVARKTMGLMGRDSSIRKYSITKDVKDLFDAYQEFLPYKDRDENDNIGITAANLFGAKCQSVRMRQELKGLQESDGYDTERASNLYLLVDYLSGYIEAESKVLKYSIRGESDSVQNDEQALQENARKLGVASVESYRLYSLIGIQNEIYSEYNTPTDSS